MARPTPDRSAPSTSSGPVLALVVAAGRGSRFDGSRPGDSLKSSQGDSPAPPKQYTPLAGRPLLRHSLLAFAHHPRVQAVQPVIHEDDHELFQTAAKGLNLLAPVNGGASRQESVRLGLQQLAASGIAGENGGTARVLIHDGARPLVDAATIDRVIDALETHEGALAALAVTDSLQREADGQVDETVDRRRLWRAQTPQGFALAPILAAHERFAGADPAFSDDVSLARAADIEVALVAGHENNLKVTTWDDLGRCERMLAGWGETRTGSGFDVHRLGPPDAATGPLMLGGIEIPFGRRLLGHSDADVALHALTDAILGALGAGDIGSHFPPGDPQWKGAASDIFLVHAGQMVAARGGRIVHLDLTLICEAPKIGPHRAAMTARIAALLGLDPGRVSVKATTTEGLGFTGRGEGIAAQAVCTLALPAAD